MRYRTLANLPLLVASEGFFCGDICSSALLTFSPGDLGCGTHLAFVAGEMDADLARNGVENMLFPGEPTPDLSPKGRAASEKSSKVWDGSDAVFLF